MRLSAKCAKITDKAKHERCDILLFNFMNQNCLAVIMWLTDIFVSLENLSSSLSRK